MVGLTYSKSLLLCAIAAALPCLQPAGAAPIAPKLVSSKTTNNNVTKDVLVVHQNSQWCGKSDLFLSENAGRFIARNGDIIIATKAPDWRIILYSRAKNVGTEMTPSEANNGNLGLMAGSITMNHGSPRPSSDHLLRLKCTTIVCPVHDSGRSSDGPLYQDRAVKILVDSTYKLANPCKLQPHLQDFLRYLYNMGDYTGVPLEGKTHFQDGSTVTSFSTSSIEHVSKPTSFFANPTGYKKVRDQLPILLEDGYSETIEDLFGAKKGK